MEKPMFSGCREEDEFEVLAWYKHAERTPEQIAADDKEWQEFLVRFNSR